MYLYNDCSLLPSYFYAQHIRRNLPHNQKLNFLNFFKLEKLLIFPLDISF